MHLLWDGAIPVARGPQMIHGRKGNMKVEVILGCDVGRVNNVCLIREILECQAEGSKTDSLYIQLEQVLL